MALNIFAKSVRSCYAHPSDAFIVCAITLLLGCAQQPSRKSPVVRAASGSKEIEALAIHAGLRFEGFYIAPATAQISASIYLRFFPNGSVISVVSSGTPAEVARWFVAGHGGVCQGQFRIFTNLLEFEVASPEVTIEYKGTINRNILTLQSHSLITGLTETKSYHFVARQF